jgi:hypothetical protein
LGLGGGQAAERGLETAGVLKCGKKNAGTQQNAEQEIKK